MEKQKLNVTLVYVLSILGLLCCCVGGIGAIASGVAFYIANKKLSEAELDPEGYENISAMKIAKIVAFVVLIINILYFIYTLYIINTVGWEEMIERSSEMQEEWLKNRQ